MGSPAATETVPMGRVGSMVSIKIYTPAQMRAQASLWTTILSSPADGSWEEEKKRKAEPAANHLAPVLL